MNCGVVVSKSKFYFKKYFILKVYLFLKMSSTLAVLSASGKTPCWNEKFIKNARGCFKSLAWFLRVLTGPKLLLS